MRSLAMFRRWKRLDFPGFETMHLVAEGDGVRARSLIIDNSDEPFAAALNWRLDAKWQSRSLLLRLVDASGEREVRIERAGGETWRVDGVARQEFDGCAEIDVSATPFCNGLALKRLKHAPGELTALYVPLPSLELQPSRQRYERAGEHWRYVDLGAAKGFTAVLEFDVDGIVRRYEGLFEAL